MIATEKRTLHFDLSHIPAATEFWLSAGAADYPLVALIRFRGHHPKGGYDGQNGIRQARATSAAAVQ